MPCWRFQGSIKSGSHLPFYLCGFLCFGTGVQFYPVIELLRFLEDTTPSTMQAVRTSSYVRDSSDWGLIDDYYHQWLQSATCKVFDFKSNYIVLREHLKTRLAAFSFEKRKRQNIVNIAPCTKDIACNTVETWQESLHCMVSTIKL